MLNDAVSYRYGRTLVSLSLLLLLPCCRTSSSSIATSASNPCFASVPPAIASAPCSTRAHDILTANDIQAASLTTDATAYDILRRLRPDFFSPHLASTGQQRYELPQLRINDVPAIDLEVLRTLPGRSVFEARYIRPLDAVNRFGSQYSGGVLLVVTLPDL